jgi:general secretion pathway protein D
MYKQGRKHEKEGKFAQAYLLYAQAAAKDPSKEEYWQRSEALRTKAVVAANVMPPPLQGQAADAAAAKPPVQLPAATPSELQAARRPQPPVELSGPAERKSFQLRNDSRALFEQIAKAYGFEVVFDGDYQPTPTMKFAIDDATYRQALQALMTATASFIVPISEKVFMVVKDTEQKRREVENTVAVTVPIPEPVSLQEAQELGRSVQQLMEIQRFAIDSAQRLVLMRDRVSKVEPAREVLRQLLHRRGQVMIELEVLSVSKTSNLGLGFTIPTTYTITPIMRMMRLTGGNVVLAMTIGNAELLAKMTKSDSKTLMKADVRAIDGEPATFHAGDKYPIMTLGYFGDTGDSNLEVHTPPPSFNFEDLGLLLKVTPRIHDSEELTLEIEANFKLLTGASLNGIPIISDRKFANRVRLQFDEWAIIGGLVTSSRSQLKSGFPGLMDIPLFGYLFSRTTRDEQDSELLLVLKPRLLDIPGSERVAREIWVGSESRMRTPM